MGDPYDSDEEPPDEPVGLRWYEEKLGCDDDEDDRSASFLSDWTIEIASVMGNDDDDDDEADSPVSTRSLLIERGGKKDDGIATTIKDVDLEKAANGDGQEGTGPNVVVRTYRVHRAILAGGASRSEYFRRLFQSGHFAESVTRKSRIELHPVGAQAFPKLLDFLYTNQLVIEKDVSPIALHHLGQYFEIPRLRWLARQHWKKHMNSTSCVTYYKHALIFYDIKVMESIKDFCAQQIRSRTYDIFPSILEVTDAAFWLEVFEKFVPPCPSQEQSRHASTILGCLMKSPLWNDMDKDTFDRLTSKTLIPSIDWRACRLFLEQSDRLSGRCSSSSSTAKEKNGKHGEELFSCLQERCVKSFAENWTCFDTESAKFETFLQDRSPIVLAKLLSRVMSKAKLDQESALKAQSETHQAEIKLYQVRLKDSAMELQECLEELERTKTCLNLFLKAADLQEIGRGLEEGRASL